MVIVNQSAQVRVARSTGRAERFSIRQRRAAFLLFGTLLTSLPLSQGFRAQSEISGASQSQIALRIVPLLSLGALSFLWSLLNKDKTPFSDRQFAYWALFCAASLVGGFRTGILPDEFTIWESVELMVPLFIIGLACKWLTAAEYYAVVERVFSWFFLLVTLSIAIQPSAITRAGQLVQIRPVFPAINPNTLGIISGIYILLAWHSNRKWRRPRLALGLLFVFGSLSRTTILLGALLWPYLTNRTRIRSRGSFNVRTVTLYALGLAVAFAAQPVIVSVLTKGGSADQDNIASLSGRVDKWEAAITAFRERPLGWGINGAYRFIRVEGQVGKFRFLGQAHNSGLDALMGGGIVGFVAFTAFWWLSLRRLGTPAHRVESPGFSQAMFLLLAGSVTASSLTGLASPLVIGLMIAGAGMTSVVLDPTNTRKTR